jgi:hypothetical protein
MESERESNQRAGLRDTRPRRTLAFSDAVNQDFEDARLRLIPRRVQLGVRLSRFTPLAMAELVHIKGHFALEHVIDGPSQLVGQDGEGFPRGVSFLQTGQHSLTFGSVAQEQRGRFGKGPLEVRVPDVLACRAHAFARGGFRTLDQAPIGDNILNPWEAINVVDVVEQHEAEDLADTRHSL